VSYMDVDDADLSEQFIELEARLNPAGLECGSESRVLGYVRVPTTSELLIKIGRILQSAVAWSTFSGYFWQRYGTTGAVAAAGIACAACYAAGDAAFWLADYLKPRPYG